MKRFDGLSFRLGSCTIASNRDKRGVEDAILRQSLLLNPKHFVVIFDELNGNVLRNIGKSRGSVFNTGKREEYRFTPFYRFEFSFANIVGEPLVFVRSDNKLFINPDILLFFELEERSSGLWWDPKKGVEVLRKQIIDRGNLEIVEILVEYLLKYLQARQKSLIISHYRHLCLFNPSQNTIGKFVKEDVVSGSSDHGAKAIFQNWGLQEKIQTIPFLQRRLHLWFEIKPAEIDIDDPWTEQPPFDIYAFTLPTRVGLVAPGRFKRYPLPIEERSFEGENCEFMDNIYFRQEVLAKYECASNFEVTDNGSILCGGYWSLNRSTKRIGNELLATAIGDFAEGVPFEEWPHWKEYAVEPPSIEAMKFLNQEQCIPDAVNSMTKTLSGLNDAFAYIAIFLKIEMTSYIIWDGSLDCIAGRQIKWVYPATANDDEFLKRATLISTLVIDGLKSESMRELLMKLGENLHESFNKSPKPLGSLKLLQRLMLIAMLMERFYPRITEIPKLVKQAETETICSNDHCLCDELKLLHRDVENKFKPIFSLYELRNSGGVAHKLNKIEAAISMANLGLSEKNWHRIDYLLLLKLVTDSIDQVNNHLKAVANLL